MRRSIANIRTAGKRAAVLEAACADLLPVDAEPLKSVNLVDEPARDLVTIANEASN